MFKLFFVCFCCALQLSHNLKVDPIAANWAGGRETVCVCVRERETACEQERERRESGTLGRSIIQMIN